MSDPAISPTPPKLFAKILACIACAAVAYAGYRIGLEHNDFVAPWIASNGGYYRSAGTIHALLRLVPVYGVVAVVAFFFASRSFLLVGFCALLTGPLIHMAVDNFGLVKMRVHFSNPHLGYLSMVENAAFAYQGIAILAVTLLVWITCRTRSSSAIDSANPFTPADMFLRQFLLLTFFVGPGILGAILGGLSPIGFYLAVTASAFYVLRILIPPNQVSQNRTQLSILDLLFGIALFATAMGYAATFSRFWNLGIHF